MHGLGWAVKTTKTKQNKTRQNKKLLSDREIGYKNILTATPDIRSVQDIRKFDLIGQILQSRNILDATIPVTPARSDHGR